MQLMQRQRAVSTRHTKGLNNNFDKSRQKYYQSLAKRQISPQIKIYNRNLYLRQAYKSLLQQSYKQQIKGLANSTKIDPISQKILQQKIQTKIQQSVQQICSLNDQSHQEQVTFQQMCEIIYRTNQFLRKAEKNLDVQQLLSQLWLYLKNYEIGSEYLDAKILCTFMKVLMNPKGIKPNQIKLLMSKIQTFQNSNQLQKKFIEEYPELQQQALQDIQVFKLWYSVRQKYNLFSRQQSMTCGQQRKCIHKNQFTFQPQISQNSRIIAEKSLKKYLSSNKLINQKSLNYHPANQQQNQLHQYLSHKVMTHSNLQRKSFDSLQKNNFSYHDLLYKRKLQRQDVSRKLYFDQNQSKQNIISIKASPSKIKQIVDKMYFIPEKKYDIDYKELKQKQELKKCTFHPNTTEYQTFKKYNASVNGFEKEVSRLKKGRQEKQKIKEIYQNLGKPKNSKTSLKTPSFIERDTPKLILEVNIGGGRIQKIKLQGTQDAKIVAKKFINKYSLQNSMLSVLQELIDQNLKNL